MIITGLIVLGLCFGSFINALVWRLHQQSLPKKRQAASAAELSIAKGRSMCPHCKHTLGVGDLIPVFSWLILGGRCRYCKKPISWQYPLVELLTAGIFVLSYLFWPYTLMSVLEWSVFGLWLATLVGLIALAVYDLKWMLLPNRVIFPLIGAAGLIFLIHTLGAPDIQTSLLSGLGGVAIASGIFYVLFQISDGRWIGGGDVKLGIVLGLLLASPIAAFLMLFVASLIGILVSVAPLLLGKGEASRQIPFGPSLIMATIICMLFGQVIIDWYSVQFIYT